MRTVQTSMMQMPDGELIKLAGAYRIKADLKKKSPGLAKALAARGLWKAATQHMPHGRRKFTLEAVKASAENYSRPCDWELGDKRAYEAARYSGWLTECCAHMTDGKTFWTEELLAADAAQYKRRVDWQRANGSAYKAARKRGLLDKVCAHMEVQKRVPKLQKKLAHTIACGMRKSLKRNKSGYSWTKFVDYDVDELKRHLERQFQPGMSWSNMGEWHIDHIIPIADFSFDSPDSQEFRACWALTNLRPLWGRENSSKRANRTLLL
jgi:hypothetical protein